MVPVLIATVSVAVIGLIIGLLLVSFGRKFAVETDPKEEAVRDLLPGNNCGGCGYAGCDACAKAIAAGEASVNACPVGGETVASRIAQVMDVEVSEMTRMVAFAQCAGDCEHAKKSANYVGIQDCSAAVTSGLTDKNCLFGCLGLGSCVKACQFDAISIVNGVAFVNRAACKACGKCIEACPKHLIELIPDPNKYVVRCSSKDRGPAVKKACSVGCIGCRICEKQCEHDAIHVENNIARIDYAKCVNCGKCAEKCPAGAIMKRLPD